MLKKKVSIRETIPVIESGKMEKKMDYTMNKNGLFRHFKTAVFFLLFIFTACSHGRHGRVESSSYNFMLNRLLDRDVPEIYVDSLKDHFDDFLLLDSREPNEFNISHMKGARYIGYDDFDIARLKEIPKDQPIVVYCSMGYRSEKITQILLKQGYQKVFNLYGGIFEWVNQDQTVFKENSPTQKIHAYSQMWGIWLNKGEKVYD